ncbi:hypothetical protein O1611_g6822 [Lasiodiplodia mahajangana]|uniref:Uncharacterized protein n=1 Tax=Lasiodiplodia mahajangana TaxID=1108764 RepID=A0ACC2JH83_9PEZI|nr:hypothetical protein O1611_g6822 [Lasiodiplodia mahajangana]
MGHRMSSPEKQKSDMNDTGGSASLVLKEEPLDGHRRMKVRVIGAGYSGIYLGIRIPQRLRNIDLQIFEKNEAVGGTWWVNRYPGPREQHLEAHSGETFQDDADVLIGARGALSNPSWPDIPGLKDFQGEVMHSAIWNDDYDFKYKKIGVIGNGSSSIQIVPSLQKVPGAQVSCFVRSKTWITNPFGDVVMEKLGLDPKKFDFSLEQRQELAQNPQKFFKFRKAIEFDGNTSHEVSLRDSGMQRGGMQLFRESMQQRLLLKPEIAEFLIPSFGIGCRRATP